jgi:hypothetical protein
VKGIGAARDATLAVLEPPGCIGMRGIERDGSFADGRERSVVVVGDLTRHCADGEARNE